MKPDFSKGLVPAVVQDAESGKVLMLAYMDEDAWTHTRDSGQAWFHSRERGLWHKGGDLGQHDGGGRGAPGLRHGLGPAASKAGGPGVPHGRGVVLLQQNRHLTTDRGR